MAIVKMKRLRLFGMQSDRESLLRLLQKAGCVEIGEPAIDLTDPDWAALAKPDGQGLANAKEQNTLLNNALTILKQYAPSKDGMFHARPVLSESQFFDDGFYANGLDTARAIVEGERTLASLLAEQGKLETQKASLAPWLPLDIPLELTGTATLSVLFGTIPVKADYAAMEAAVGQATELAALTYASADRDLHYFVLLCHASAEQACTEAMRPFGYSRANVRGWTGTAADNDRMLDNQLATVERRIAEARDHIASFGPQRDALRQCIDRSVQEVGREDNKARLIDTEAAFLLEGWLPADREGELSNVLSGFTCAWETEVPEEEDYPQVPIQLRNNWFTKPLNMVTDMYSLPAYGSVDPNPLMAPFFIVFYGMMMADMGYGLLMMLASIFVIKKTKPKGATMRYMMPLLGLCGVSTFIWGALTGGFFGDLIPQLRGILTGVDPASVPLWSAFDPLSDAVPVLIGALILGVIQVFTGMIVSMYMKFKRGKVLDALCNEGAWFLVFIMAGVGYLIGHIAPCVIAAVVVLVIAQAYGKKGFGIITGIFGALYNGITGYFSDILSYSRLMALMLAGAVVAQVFNQLGAMTGNIITFIIIALIGNALNFALNILGCYVHDMRLQCLEFFGRFYEDGGRSFSPLNINTKYVDVEKQ